MFHSLYFTLHGFVCLKKNEKSKQKENFLTEKGFSFHYVRIITVSTCLFTQKNDVCYGTHPYMKAEEGTTKKETNQ